MHRFAMPKVLIVLLFITSSGQPLRADASPGNLSSANEPFPSAYVAARDAGWAEAVLQVRSPHDFVKFAESVGGWRVREVADGEWWIADAESGVGTIRLLRAPRDALRRTRYQPWDSGGLFSVMARSNDLAAAYRRASELGWSSANAPVALDFGGVKLANVVLRSVDGVNIAVYERRQPRLPDALDLLKLRRPFNSMQVVRDLAEARRFYVYVLGFAVIASGRFQAPKGTPSNFGVPASVAADTALDYLILGPSATGPTQIEVVNFVGVEGRVRPRDSLETEGLIALRFPVTSLSKLRLRLEAAGHPHEVAVRAMPPFGSVKMVRLRSPEGARLEFFELP